MRKLAYILMILISALSAIAVIPSFNIDDITMDEDTSDTSIDLDDYATGVNWTISTSSRLNVVVDVDKVVNITPDRDWNGVDTLTFKATNPSDSTDFFADNVTVTVNPINDAPTINLPASRNIVKSESGSLDLNSFSDDNDNDPLSYLVILEEVANVDCSIANSTLTFAAQGNFTGTSSCTIQVTDGISAASDSMNIIVQDAAYDFSNIADITLTGNNDDNLSSSFTIRNNGNADLTGVSVTSNLDSKYKATFGTVPSTLTPGQSSSVSFTIYTPKGESQEKHQIGTISLNSNERTEQFGLFLDLNNKMDIDRVDVTVGKDTDNEVSDGDTISEDAEPGDKLVFEVEVDNLYTDDEDVEMQDIIVTVTIEGIDDGDDLEEESAEFDIPADDSERPAITMEVPQDAEDDTYNVIITAEGDDENGISHEVSMQIDLKVQRVAHKILIQQAAFRPTSVKCGGVATLDIELQNIGRSSEEEVTLDIQSDELSIDRVERRIEMDSDPDEDTNLYEKSYTVNIPKELETRKYTVTVKSFYDDDILSEIATPTIDVDCTKKVDIVPEVPPEVIVPGKNDTKITSAPIVYKKLEESEKTPSATNILLIVNGIFIVLLIGWIARLLIR